MSRKDDPVFNVKFVQAVERNQCLWNSTLPAYSKKEEIQKAWQDVANETKDTVRSCRERWRTIRSSFLRSLKMSRTNTGRGKRKYYLSKYLQFLIPYTKSRLKHSPAGSMMALRKYSTSVVAGMDDEEQSPSHTPLPTPPPMTCINQMPLPIVSSDDTKDTNSSDIAAITEEDIVVSLIDTDAQVQPEQPDYQVNSQQPLQQLIYNLNRTSTKNNSNNPTYSLNTRNVNSSNNGFYNATTSTFQHHHQSLRLPSTIKSEPRTELGLITPPGLNHASKSTKTTNTIASNYGGVSTATETINTANKHASSDGNNSDNNSKSAKRASSTRATTAPSSATATATVDLGEFADWIKHRNGLTQNSLRPHGPAAVTAPDADQSFLNSLHPFLKEMSGKQNRRFRQKVVALIDAILDNAD